MADALMTKGLKGLEKAAIFFANIGEDAAAEIVKYLEPSEIQLIGRKVTELADVPPEVFMEVVEDFEKEISLDQVPVDVDEYIKNVILKALGPEKAAAILKRISRRPEDGGIETLKWMDPKVVCDFIKNEHPQTVAVILSNLQPEQSAAVIRFLDARTRADVIMRIATMESIAPGALEELEDAINQNLSGTIGIHTRTLGGVKTAAEILNQVDTKTENEILAAIETVNAGLSNEIQEKMFVFADIIRVDERGIQRILKDITNEQLILALKTAEEELKQKFLRNMSERARDMLVEEMDTRGPVKLSDVNQAQIEIVRVTRKLEQDGELTIGGGEGGDVLV
jgi:flagellar motor switch protein FliG